MNLVTTVIEFIKGLIKPISVAIGSFLLYRQGKQAEQKKAAEEHVKDAQEAQTLNDHIDSMSNDTLDSLLGDNKPNGKSKNKKGS